MSVETIAMAVGAALVALIAIVREWTRGRAIATAEQRGRIDQIERQSKAAADGAAKEAEIAADAAGDEDAAQRAIEERAKATLGEPIKDEAMARIIARSKGRPPS